MSTLNIKEHENTNVKISGVKNKNDVNNHELSKYCLPNINTCVLFIGTPGSGKTSLMISILKYYNQLFDNIFLYSSSLSTLPKSFINNLNDDHIYESMDNLDELLTELSSTQYKSLFIFDDMMRHFKSHDKSLSNLIQNRRHIGGGCTIWILTQKLREIPLNIRTGVSDIIFFNGSSKIKTELESLYDDYITGLSKNEFISLIKYIFSDNKNHNFLYYNINSNQYHKNFNLLDLFSPN
jgi:hypothetical protein